MLRFLLLLLALSLIAPSLSAQVSPERERELATTYDDATEHYQAKRYTDALPMFQQVATELNSPNALLYVARCLREMGRLVEAHAKYEQTVTLAAERAQTEKRFAPTHQAAQKELRELELRLGRVTVSVPDAPAGTVIEVAGRQTAQHQLVVVAPGEVTVDVRAPGHAPVRRQINAAAGSQQNLIVELAPPSPPPSPPPPAAPSTRTITSGGGVRIAGYAVLGVGVIGWVAVIVGGVLSDDRFEQIQMRCPNPPCATDADQDIIDEGRDFELAANIGLGLGAAGTVAGALMIIFGGPTEETVAAPPVALVPLPGGGAMTVHGSF